MFPDGPKDDDLLDVVGDLLTREDYYIHACVSLQSPECSPKTLGKTLTLLGAAGYELEIIYAMRTVIPKWAITRSFDDFQDLIQAARNLDIDNFEDIHIDRALFEAIQKLLAMPKIITTSEVDELVGEIRDLLFNREIGMFTISKNIVRISDLLAHAEKNLKALPKRINPESLLPLIKNERIRGRAEGEIERERQEA